MGQTQDVPSMVVYFIGPGSKDSWEVRFLEGKDVDLTNSNTEHVTIVWI